jgi:hypothetical protein
MPQIDSALVSLLAGVFSSLTQLIKGVLLTDEQKRWLPLGAVVLCGVVGMLLAFYYGSDPVSGLVAGVIAGLSSVGLYETGKSIAPKAINGSGWVKKKD